MFNISYQSRFMPLFFLVSVGSLFGMEETAKDTTTKLMKAIKDDDAFVVKQMLQRKEVGIEDRFVHGATPLLYAALTGATETGELLLEMGADKKAENAYGTGVVELAAINNKCAFLEMLHNKGFDLDHRPNRRMSTLEAAISYDQVESTRFLLDHGVYSGPCKMLYIEGSSDSCEISLPILHFAVASKAFFTAKLLLTKYKDLCNVNTPTPVGSFSVTPHDIAVMNSLWDMVILLKDHGSDDTSHTQHLKYLFYRKNFGKDIV